MLLDVRSPSLQARGAKRVMEMIDLGLGRQVEIGAHYLRLGSSVGMLMESIATILRLSMPQDAPARGDLLRAGGHFRCQNPTPNGADGLRQLFDRTIFDCCICFGDHPETMVR